MPDEPEQGMTRADLFVGQHPPDLVGAAAKPLQRLQLAVVIVGQGQRLCRLHADLIARQTGERVGVQGRQAQHLLDVGQRHTEPRRNVLWRSALGAKIAISDHRIGDVHILAADVLGQGQFDRLGLVAHVHADGMAGRYRLGLLKLLEGTVATASGGDLEAIAFGIDDEVLQLAVREHVGGKLVDGLGLHAPHVERRQAKLR